MVLESRSALKLHVRTRAHIDRDAVSEVCDEKTPLSQFAPEASHFISEKHQLGSCGDLPELTYFARESQQSLFAPVSAPELAAYHSPRLRHEVPAQAYLFSLVGTACSNSLGHTPTAPGNWNGRGGWFP